MPNIKLLLTFMMFYTTTQLIRGTKYHSLLEELKYCKNAYCYPNRSEDFNSTNCACDSKCFEYRDCCSNAEVEFISSRKEYKVSCISKGTDPVVGVLAINQCPYNFSRVHQSELLRRCSGEDDLSYPALSVPVTNPFTNVTYRNAFCAACYDESPGNLMLWDIKVTCDTLDPEKYRLRLGDFAYDPDQKTWGIRVDGMGPLHPCRLVFQPPPVKKALRSCLLDLVETCPAGTDSYSIELSECGRYTARVYSTEGIAYRNPHCAACNNVESYDLRCKPQHTTTTLSSKQNSFQTVINLNSRKDVHMIHGNTYCEDEKKFDPFFDRCRDPFLAVRGYEMIDEGRQV